VHLLLRTYAPNLAISDTLRVTHSFPPPHDTPVGIGDSHSKIYAPVQYSHSPILTPIEIQGLHKNLAIWWSQTLHKYRRRILTARQPTAPTMTSQSQCMYSIRATTGHRPSPISTFWLHIRGLIIHEHVSDVVQGTKKHLLRSACAFDNKTSPPERVYNKRC